MATLLNAFPLCTQIQYSTPQLTKARMNSPPQPTLEIHSPISEIEMNKSQKDNEFPWNIEAPNNVESLFNRDWLDFSVI